jgi:hypothetical protein
MVGERPMFFSLVSHTFILNSRDAESKSPIPEMVCMDHPSKDLIVPFPQKILSRKKWHQMNFCAE